MGEFGRTPHVGQVTGDNGTEKGGQVIGSSTPDGSGVKDRPVTVNDLMASFCQALKIDPKKENVSPQGRPIKIVDGGSPIKELFA